ncbi:MAG: metallopeptidase TldD-related protein, partial [Thermoplasmata archaeon]|nr:metallopeptidase TldD-related protein [Thermoplasmata archaeon]
MPAVAESKAQATLERLFDLLPARLDADARLTGERFGTMRFATGRIHQPQFESATGLSLRVYEGGRLGTATTDEFTKEGLRRLIEQARSLARVAPPEERFPGFPSAPDRRARAVPFSRPTASITPERLGDLASRAIEKANEKVKGARVSGAFHAGSEWIAVANSAGLRGFTQRSVAQASVLIERPEADPPVSGWSELADWDASRIDPEKLSLDAAGKVARRAPESIAAGSYRVVLGPCAVSELISSLGYLGFSGHGEQEGWSCLKSERGKAAFPSSVDLRDDGTSERSLPQGIDYEGSPKRPTPLIDSGVVGDAVTDLVTAGRLGRSPSGHGLPPESPWGDFGPIPTQLLLGAGDASVDELVK